MKTIEYERINDYDLPLLRLRQEESYNMGFFGRRYKSYLKENHKAYYYRLLTSQRLLHQIKLVEDEAKQRYESLIKSLSKQENINEELKANDPMKWIQMMNNIKDRAIEVTLNEVIYHYELKEKWQL